jgi:hypothetical protein
MTGSQVAAVRRQKMLRAARQEAESYERMAQRLATVFGFEDSDDAIPASAEA